MSGLCNHHDIKKNLFAVSRSRSKPRSGTKEIKKSNISNRFSMTKKDQNQVQDPITVILFGSEACGHCVNAVKLITKSRGYNLIKNYFDDISSAIEKANEFRLKNPLNTNVIDGIPAIFDINGLHLKNYRTELKLE